MRERASLGWNPSVPAGSGVRIVFREILLLSCPTNGFRIVLVIGATAG